MNREKTVTVCKTVEVEQDVEVEVSLSDLLDQGDIETLIPIDEYCANWDDIQLIEGMQAMALALSDINTGNRIHDMLDGVRFAGMRAS